jgi:ABC-type methionine transport system permease subunit
VTEYIEHMYRLILKCIFVISMCLSFYKHILVKNSSQSYISKIVSLSKTTPFLILEGVDGKFSVKLFSTTVGFIICTTHNPV